MFLRPTAWLPILGVLSLSFAENQKILKEKKDKNPLDKKFAELVKETLALWNVPGLSVAVVDGDDIFAEGYGIATFPDKPATASTLYYTGSTTKAFTAAAISLLIDNSSQYSNIQWDTPVADLLRDEFVLEDDYATTHITIEDILSHRTGMPRHDMSYGGKYDGHDAVPGDVVRSLRYLPLTAEPRTTYQYCNMMFVTASHIVETLTNMWLGDFLKEKIWKPLGMHSTYFSTSDAQAAPEHLAQGYVYYNQIYQPVRFMDVTIASGAGAIISNVLDYAQWIHAQIYKLGPISQAGYEATRTSRTMTPSEPPIYTGPSTYTLGWEKHVYKGYEMLEHAGGMEAYGALVVYFPELEYGVVALGNTAVTSNQAEMTLVWKLIDDKLGIPEKDRFDFNKHGKDVLKKGEWRYDNALDIYYPNRPDPKLPLSISLQDYAGTYSHPGYRNMVVELKNDVLYIAREDVSWPLAADLQHVSGDYFIAYVDSLTAPGLIFRAGVAAEFRIGSDGLPSAFGIAIEETMGTDGRIWFDRVKT